MSTENGTVAVNVEQIVENVKQRLDAKGITVLDNVKVPPDKQQLVIIQSKDLEQVQGLVDFLQKIAWFIPLIALACFAGAIGLSGNRRRTILRGAIGVAFAVAVQLVLLKAGRNLYLDAVTTNKSTPGAAGSVWDQLTSFLRTSGLTAIALALVIAFAAWVVGPSSAAVSVRGWWHRAFGTARGSGDAGPVAGFVARSQDVAARHRRRDRLPGADRLEPSDRAHGSRRRDRAGRLPGDPGAPRPQRDRGTGGRFELGAPRLMATPPGSRPEPKPTPETAHFWEGTAAGELRLQRCRACDLPYFPPQPFCPRCRSSDVEVFRASGSGTLHSYVINHRAAPGFTAPYVIAVVELDEGPRLLTNLVDVAPDPDALPLDLPLEVRFETVGEAALAVFRPRMR